MPSQLSEMRIANSVPSASRSLPRDERGTARGRSKGGRPTRQEAVELDSRILDTAARLFASQGFAATSMEQVASECGSGKDTIYRRYPSKIRLFQALMDRLRTQVVSELDQCLQECHAPVDRLRRYARALFSINLRPEVLALNRVALAETIAFGGVGSGGAIPVAEDPVIVRLAALVEEAQADRTVATADNPLFVAEQLVNATSTSLLIWRAIGQERFCTSFDEDAYFDQAWTLFMNGASSQRPASLSPRSVRSQAAPR